MQMDYSMSLYRKKCADGSVELKAFFDHPIGRWLTNPCIEVWPIDPSDLKNAHEDKISINGCTFAWTIHDNRPEDYGDMIEINDPSDCTMPTYMMAIGLLTQRLY